LKIAVCLKQILDPDIPAREFTVSADSNEAERGGANLVTNIFCENALETALQFKEKAGGGGGGGGEITVLSFGAESAEDSLRKALAMTADSACLIVNDRFEHPDPLAVAQVLAAALKKLGDFDLILVGRESGDWGAGQIGGLLAEILDMPCVSFVDSIEKTADGVRLKRQTGNGMEIAEASTPLVLTVTNDDKNVPRVPKTRDVMMSYRKPLTKFSLSDLAIDGQVSGSSYYEIVELSIPEKNSECELATGDSIEEKVADFARRVMSVTGSM
jgi:electron transfer flavoprotein beta subunit